MIRPGLAVMRSLVILFPNDSWVVVLEETNFSQGSVGACLSTSNLAMKSTHIDVGRQA